MAASNERQILLKVRNVSILKFILYIPCIIDNKFTTLNQQNAQTFF